MFRFRRKGRDQGKVELVLAILPHLNADLQSYRIAKEAMGCLEDVELKSLLHNHIWLTGPGAPFFIGEDSAKHYCASMDMEEALKEVASADSEEKANHIRWQNEAKQMFLNDLEAIRLEIMRKYGI